jgi:glycosyltransferase involved in cell wall biosynthesis
VKKIDLVIPVLNEFEVINELLVQLGSVKTELEAMQYEVAINLVDDGSDKEFKDLLIDLKENFEFRVLELSRNYGQQVALKAGIENSDGDAVVCLDADLQDPPELIIDMVKHWEDGFDVVHTIRSKREKESLTKKVTANIFYRILDSNSKVKLTRNAGDFKLISKKIVEIIKNSNDDDLYLRGLVDWYGGNKKFIYYDRNPRYAGKRKYKYKQSFDLAINGLISYSDFLPNLLLRLLFFAIVVLIFLFAFLTYSFLNYSNDLVRGWSSTVAILIFSVIIQVTGFFFVVIYLKKITNQTSGKKGYTISKIV